MFRWFEKGEARKASPEEMAESVSDAVGFRVNYIKPKNVWAYATVAMATLIAFFGWEFVSDDRHLRDGRVERQKSFKLLAFEFPYDTEYLSRTEYTAERVKEGAIVIDQEYDRVYDFVDGERRLVNPPESKVESVQNSMEPRQ